MNLLCLVCSINSENIKDVRPARYIVNGQSVCSNHVNDVTAAPGNDFVVVQGPK